MKQGGRSHEENIPRDLIILFYSCTFDVQCRTRWTFLGKRIGKGRSFDSLYVIPLSKKTEWQTGSKLFSDISISYQT